MRLGRRKALIAGAALYAIFIFLGFTLWRLPVDKIVPYVADKISGGRVLLEVEKSALSLPLGCKLERISYAFKGAPVPARGRLENLTLGINLPGLLRARVPFFFKTSLSQGGGLIQGNAGLSFFGTPRKAYFESKASNVDLDQLGILKALSGRDVKGRVDWQVNLQNLADPTAMIGQGSIVVHKGSIDTKLDLAGLKSIPFELVRIPFKAKDGQLSVEKGEMEGPMLSVTLSGQIKLNKKLGSSVLDLTARLRVGPLFKNNPLASAFLGKARDSKREIVMKIRGTADNPTMTPEH